GITYHTSLVSSQAAFPRSARNFCMTRDLVIASLSVLLEGYSLAASLIGYRPSGSEIGEWSLAGFVSPGAAPPWQQPDSCRHVNTPSAFWLPKRTRNASIMPSLPAR
ncbi:MAG TPA: hypothetical protein VEJ22_01360, partial [Nitrospirota bacterium]|nr:hypothetical protein [Nitrospirota bacterium]